MAAMSLRLATSAFHPRSCMVVRVRSACTPATTASAASSNHGADGVGITAASSPIQTSPRAAAPGPMVGRWAAMRSIAANSPLTKLLQ
jgi:hypothetical protein